jgi:hypothetical protein
VGMPYRRFFVFFIAFEAGKSVQYHARGRNWEFGFDRLRADTVYRSEIGKRQQPVLAIQPGSLVSNVD